MVVPYGTSNHLGVSPRIDSHRTPLQSTIICDYLGLLHVFGKGRVTIHLLRTNTSDPNPKNVQINPPKLVATNMAANFLCYFPSRQKTSARVSRDCVLSVSLPFPTITAVTHSLFQRGLNGTLSRDQLLNGLEFLRETRTAAAAAAALSP